MLRYTEAFPEQLDQAWTAGAPAIVPFGALEWHGAHLPLGLDGLVAESFAEKLAGRVGGVLLPPFYTPITTLPHRHSLQVPTEAFRLLIDELLVGLVRSGARRVAFVTGHYAQGHEVELYEAALRAMSRCDCLVFAATPLEVLEEDELLDHAGMVETAQLLAIRPDLVRLEILPATLVVKRDAVLGGDPRDGTAGLGEALLARALDRWAAWLRSDANALNEFYSRRLRACSGYRERYYRESWEQAIVDWWSER